MAARPPSAGETEEPDAVAFGIAAVDDHLSRAEIEFPATVSEVVAATGDPDVPYSAGGRTLALSDALAETGVDAFESRRDLLDALHPVFEDHRNTSSVLAWLRGVLPFN